MPREHELVTEPGDDDRLNDTDKDIIDVLRQGRETTGSLAEQLDKHPQTVRDRLKWLREWGYVRYYHENTGLHELNADAEDTDD